MAGTQQKAFKASQLRQMELRLLKEHAALNKNAAAKLVVTPQTSTARLHLHCYFWCCADPLLLVVAHTLYQSRLPL